jgi:hypothetical protein
VVTDVSDDRKPQYRGSLSEWYLIYALGCAVLTVTALLADERGLAIAPGLFTIILGVIAWRKRSEHDS